MVMVKKAKKAKRRPKGMGRIFKVNYYIARNFREDGYCPEGIGYWDYGFGSYIEMNEIIHLQTGGKVNLLQGTAKMEAIMRFPLYFEMNGMWPAFSDARIKTNLDYCDYWPFLVLRGGVNEYRFQPFLRRFGGLRRVLLRQHALDSGFTATVGKAESPLYHYFRESGVIISRAAKDDDSGFALAFKAGDNVESHNHNDVGSFVVALRGVPVITDPGYPAGSSFKLYSSERYRNDFCNSFGHPVPVAGDMLQKNGAEFHGRITATEFLPEKTTALIDLKSAYPETAKLTRLERSFTHDRNRLAVTVTDEAEFAVPSTFGSALITYGKVKELAPGEYRINWRGATVKAIITSEKPLNFKLETLKNRARSGVKEPATHLGYEAAGPDTEHRMTVIITLEQDQNAADGRR